MILKGIVVSKCSKLLTGKVRIITKDNLNDFNKNEILVSFDTNPNYLFIMKKAKVILTETGGLLSHAAIVSRELNIPCIVNVKSITQKLKTGDVVNVDFNKAIISKI